MKKKNIVLLCMLMILVNTFTVRVNSFGNQEHDEFMEQVLFGKTGMASTDSKNLDKIKMLKYASYLCLDQDNAQGEDKLVYLQKRVGSMPKSLDVINFFGGSDHRRYTHMGWDNPNYPVVKSKGVDKANWAVRKDILLLTVNEVFDFGFFSKRFFAFDMIDKKANSLAAILYHTHVIADHIDGSNGRQINSYMMPLCGKANETGYVIYEIKENIDIAFEDLKNSKDADYSAFIKELDKWNKELYQQTELWDDPNNIDFEDLQEYCDTAQELMDTMIDYLPKLLGKEIFFTNAFMN